MKKMIGSIFVFFIFTISSLSWADKLLIDEYVWTDDTRLDFLLEQRINPTDPPTPPVRAIAEFEPAEAVLIRYPLGIPTAFVALLSEEIDVVCIVGSQWQQNQASSDFSSAGVNMDNLSYIIADTDSYWTRDYTSWYIVNGNQEVSALNFEYNRPRPADNNFPSIFASEYNYPYYAMNIAQTGGNFMTDGYGIASSSHIAYTENNNNENLVDNTMLNYMGIENYMVVQDPNGTYIDHIDCWGKFLDVDKVLIREVPESHSQYDEIEDVAQMFASSTCSWGYPYQVFRVYTPNDQPYTNSLILNDRVFVPQTGSLWDDDALEVYQEAMPGYRIFGVTNSTYTPWESTDALHCRTHEVPSQDMLSIRHYPHYGSIDQQLIHIETNIINHSGESIYSDSTIVYYKDINSSVWQSQLLTQHNDYLWSTEIGPFENNQVIQYYLHTADQAGNSEDYPLVGKEDPFEFLYLTESELTPPVIEFTPFENPVDPNNLILEVVCQVEDADGDLDSVVLKYNIAGVNGNLQMDNTSANIYQVGWSLSADEISEDTIITYYIEATDLAGLSTSTPVYEIVLQGLSNQDNQVEDVSAFTSVYPNPFWDVLQIKFKTQENKQSIKIYNLRGQLVKEIKAQVKAGGIGQVKWNGRDNNGNQVGSGVYYMLLETATNRDIKKVVLMK